MKKWYAKKSIAGKLVTSFIAMGVMIIVLCLLTLNGAGLVFAQYNSYRYNRRCDPAVLNRLI